MHNAGLHIWNDMKHDATNKSWRYLSIYIYIYYKITFKKKHDITNSGEDETNIL